MRIAQIEYTRALAALLVLLYHIELTFELPKYLGATFPIFLAAKCGVQVFFVISGFVMYLVHGEDEEHSRSALTNFYVRRFRRIYIPLWVVLVLLTPVFALNLFASTVTPYDYIAAYTILPVKYEVLLAVEWTLRHEILFYLLFGLFIWHRLSGTIALCLWALGGSLVTMTFSVDWLTEFLFSSNHVLFLFGMLLAYCYRKHVSIFPLGCLVIGLLVFFATWYSVLARLINDDVSNIAYGIGATLTVFGFINRSKNHYELHPILKAAADASYSLYLIHFPLISILCKVYKFVGHYDNFGIRLGYFILSAVICQTAAIVFHHQIEKPILRYAAKRERPQNRTPYPR